MNLKKRLTAAAGVFLSLCVAAGCGAGAAGAPGAAASGSPPSSAAAEPAAPEPRPSPNRSLTTAGRATRRKITGWDPAVLTRLHEALEGSSVHAMVTAKDGVLIDEYYGEGYDETSVFPLHSCSKSFTGALVGIAIDEGLFGGVDDPLSDYLPQAAEPEDARKRQITLRHLLTHTSGLEWYEWGGGQSNWAEFQSAPDWVAYILGRRLTAEPGRGLQLQHRKHPPALRGPSAGRRQKSAGIRAGEAL